MENKIIRRIGESRDGQGRQYCGLLANQEGTTVLSGQRSFPFLPFPDRLLFTFELKSDFIVAHGPLLRALFLTFLPV